MANFYQVEITDTFGGEANYSWVRRYLVRAKSQAGAVQKMARTYGSGWRTDGYRWLMQGACICMFVDEVSSKDANYYVKQYFAVEQIGF